MKEEGLMVKYFFVGFIVGVFLIFATIATVGLCRMHREYKKAVAPAIEEPEEIGIWDCTRCGRISSQGLICEWCGEQGKLVKRTKETE